MGNPSVSSITLTLKDQGGGVFGTKTPIVSDWSLFATVSGATTVTKDVNGGKTVSWDEPLIHGDGTTIVAEVTGYDVFKKDGEESYAVRTLWLSGRSELSIPVEAVTWLDSLDAPDGTNTFDATDFGGGSAATINTYIDTLSATGGVVYLSSSAGNISLTDNNSLIQMDQDGVFLLSVPGEQPAKLIGTYLGLGVAPTESNQRIIEVTADNCRVHSIEINRSGRYGILDSGVGNIITENWVHEIYDTGIIYGFAEGNTPKIEYNLVERTGIDPGIWQTFASPQTFNVDGGEVIRNMTTRCGYDLNDDNIDPNGNADGMRFSKSFHDIYDIESGSSARDGNTDGRWNASQNNFVCENVVYANSDDGIDESFGEGSIVIGNLIGNNGPRGNRGIKGFYNDRGAFETVKYLGNGSVTQNIGSAATIDSVGNNGGNARFFYTEDEAFNPLFLNATHTIGITGMTEGTYNLSSGTSIDAVDTVNKSFDVDAVSFAGTDSGGTVLVNSSSVGYEIQGNDHAGTNTSPLPPLHTVSNTALNNNNLSGGTTRSIFSTSFGTGGDCANNVSENGVDQYDTSNHVLITNHEDTDAAPAITDVNYRLISETQLGAYGTFTVKQIWQHKYREIQAKLMVTKSGNVYNNGTLLTDHYHTNAADDATEPSAPDDLTKLKWYEGDKSTPVPDRGVPYVNILSPLNVTIADTP